MDRRAFLAGAAALLAAPLGAEAQQAPAKVARIGYVSLRPGPTHLDEAFQRGLRELGYVEGQNISVEYRYADWNPNRVSALAEELVRLNVDIIVSVGGNVAALAVKKVVKAIPVVFTSGDPVAIGIVARLDRPGANLTGVNLLTTELNPKRLELLRAAIPGVARVAVLANPAAPNAKVLGDLHAAARSLGVKLQVVDARSPQEIDQAFSAMVRERAGALLVLANPMFLAERERIAGLVSKNRLPAIFEQSEFAEAGGLLSYGASIADMYRRLATYVDKILKGAKPGDLPVEQPTKFELVINLKTAKALGLTIPPSLLARADQVIE
jgi:putative ABC transport system substrate-binding protein